MDIEDLLTFVEVADAGGITAAARRLGVSKSIVSRRLIQLEAELGVQLLARTTRGAALTEAGITFRDHAARIGAEIEAARETILPDGDLVVVERRASILGGFGARIVRVPGASIEAGAELSGTELAVLEPPVTTDNFEGISVVATPDGRTLLYLVSDDNLWGFQRTLLMMFEIGA